MVHLCYKVVKSENVKKINDTWYISAQERDLKVDWWVIVTSYIMLGSCGGKLYHVSLIPLYIIDEVAEMIMHSRASSQKRMIRIFIRRIT